MLGKSTITIDLKATGTGNMVKIIKLIRYWLGCSLMEAKDVYDRAADISGTGVIEVTVDVVHSVDVTQLIDATLRPYRDAGIHVVHTYTPPAVSN